MKNFPPNHYERAFENWLIDSRVRYVSVDEHKRAAFGHSKIKSFDYLVYPPSQPKIIADVKGRKLPFSAYNRGRLGESWATADDLEGMQCWQEVFGSDYLAVFVFAYWLVNDPAALDEPEKIAPDNRIFHFGQRFYIFEIIELSAYRLCARRRSASWKTVYVPAKVFRQLVQPFDLFIRTAGKEYQMGDAIAKSPKII